MQHARLMVSHMVSQRLQMAAGTRLHLTAIANPTKMVMHCAPSLDVAAYQDTLSLACRCKLDIPSLASAAA